MNVSFFTIPAENQGASRPAYCTGAAALQWPRPTQGFAAQSVLPNGNSRFIRGSPDQEDS
jgi:hypothetical protein